MSKKTVSDHEDFIMSVIYDHGPMRFTAAADLTACESLTRDGYIDECEGCTAKQLTPKGLRYLRQNA